MENDLYMCSRKQMTRICLFEESHLTMKKGRKLKDQSSRLGGKVLNMQLNKK